MKILILNGSPRPKGNTKQMIDAFCAGLEKAGHEWDVLDVCRLNIHGWLACEYCHGKGNGQCVDGPYPFFRVHHQSVMATTLWMAALIGLITLISIGLILIR